MIRNEMVIMELATKTFEPWYFLRMPPLAKHTHPLKA